MTAIQTFDIFKPTTTHGIVGAARREARTRTRKRPFISVDPLMQEACIRGRKEGSFATVTVVESLLSQGLAPGFPSASNRDRCDGVPALSLELGWELELE